MINHAHRATADSRIKFKLPKKKPAACKMGQAYMVISFYGNPFPCKITHCVGRA